MARTGRGVTLWSFLAEEVTPFMVSAIHVLGLEVLAAEDEGMALPDQEAVGRELLRLVFDARDGGPELPAVLTDLIADPDNEAAATRLTGRLFQTFKADPGMTSAAAAMIARFYRRQADGGDIRALVGYWSGWMIVRLRRPYTGRRSRPGTVTGPVRRLSRWESY